MTSSYAELSTHLSPEPLVMRAVTLVKKKESAFDIGAGSLRNTKFLLEKGFQVTAIDKDPLIVKYAKKINNDSLTTVVTTIEEFELKSTFDLVIAINTLPFLKPSVFDETFEKIKHTLNDEGLLCLTLFGKEDEWSNNKEMTFLDGSDIAKYMNNFNVIVFIEEKSHGTTITGDQKFWHIYRIIAQKQRADQK